MKKIQLLTFFMMLFGEQTFAQINRNNNLKSSNFSNNKGFWIGLQGGAVLASATINKADVAAIYPDAKIDYVAGFQGGLAVKYGFSGHFSLNADVIYSQIGAKITSGSDFLQTKGNVINVPLMLNYAFGEGKVQPFINIGAYGNYLLNAEGSVNFFGINQTQNILLDDLKTRFDFGAVGGAGLAFNVSNKSKILLDARYYYGLGNSYIGTSTVSGTQPQYRTISVAVAYIIKL